MISGGGGGSRTRVPTRSNEDFYMLISSLLFFVLCRSRWTGLAPDYSFLCSHLKPKDDCFRLERWMTPWPPSTPQGRQRGRAIRLPVRTLRSQLSFWPMFNEANDHPRHAINTQPGRSTPEHPQLSTLLIYHLFTESQAISTVFPFRKTPLQRNLTKKCIF